jgi:hypothetical protein
VGRSCLAGKRCGIVFIYSCARYIASPVHFLPSSLLPAPGSPSCLCCKAVHRSPDRSRSLLWGTLRGQPASVKLVSGSYAVVLGECLEPCQSGRRPRLRGGTFFHLLFHSHFHISPDPDSRPLPPAALRVTGLHRHRVPEVVTESAGRHERVEGGSPPKCMEGREGRG